MLYPDRDPICTPLIQIVLRKSGILDHIEFIKEQAIYALGDSSYGTSSEGKGGQWGATYYEKINILNDGQIVEPFTSIFDESNIEFITLTSRDKNLIIDVKAVIMGELNLSFDSFVRMGEDDYCHVVSNIEFNRSTSDRYEISGQISDRTYDQSYVQKVATYLNLRF